MVFCAAQRLHPKLPCHVEGSLLDDLLLVYGLAPVLEADLRAAPHLELFATDASPSGATWISETTWRDLQDLTKARRTRLDGGSEAPPRELTPARCACAAIVALLPWSVSFQYKFKTPDHINIWELSALTSLVKRLAHTGARW